MKACSIVFALALLGCADKTTQPATATSESAAAAKPPVASVVKSAETGATTTSTPASAAPASVASSPSSASAASAAAPAEPVAEIGQPAPSFKLKNLDGKEVELASFKGKTVVLEWFNPGCPFVKKSHGKGSLKGYASTLSKKGVVWLAINSGAPGKQGAGVDANREGAKALDVKNPILLDESGVVGKAYGATNTPHMFVIDKKGTLVYAGAIDNSPDAEGESPEGGKLVNYVADAIDAIEKKKPVAVLRTKAYGCSVKYQ